VSGSATDVECPPADAAAPSPAPDDDRPLIRRVGSRLEVEVRAPSRIVLQVAVADLAPAEVAESLEVTLDGELLEPMVVPTPHGGRAHVVDAGPGSMLVDYHATVTGRSAPSPVDALDEMLYLRPSRYAESDRLSAIARADFGGIVGGADLLASVSSWVGTQLSYVPGSSGPTDGAVDTLLLRQGVCRDYAHLVVALLRALDVPARLAAVYAPGLAPMDFHAVAEALVDDAWQVVDSTLLAPRSTLVRISTGRDASDTAFLSSYRGELVLLNQTVSATVDSQLPDDDVHRLHGIT
jgi:transglutaminase-like putative cysteine protease